MNDEKIFSHSAYEMAITPALLLTVIVAVVEMSLFGLFRGRLRNTRKVRREYASIRILRKQSRPKITVIRSGWSCLMRGFCYTNTPWTEGQLFERVKCQVV